MAPPDDKPPADDELDPETVANLARWFGAPGEIAVAQDDLERERELLAEQGVAPPEDEAPQTEPEEPEETPAQARARKRAEALAVVDLGLVATLERRGAEAGDLLGPPIEPPEPMVDPSIARLDLGAWNLRFLGDPREHEIPDEIYEALHENAPQALLRDLHRPVNQYHPHLHPVELGIDTTGSRTREHVRELIAARYAVDFASEPVPRAIMDEAAAELRDILDAPWEEAKRDNRPDASDVPPPFFFGGYDPDL